MAVRVKQGRIVTGKVSTYKYIKMVSLVVGRTVTLLPFNTTN